VQRIAKVHNFVGMWQGRQNLLATQKESRAQNKQMTPVVHILDTEKIVNACWLLFQHDVAAAFQLSETSPLPPALSANNLPGVRTEISNVRRMQRFNRKPVEIDEDWAPAIISNIEDWLQLNQDLDNPNDTEDDCATDIESDIVQGICIDDPQFPEQRNVSAVPNVAWLIQTTQKSNVQAEKVFVKVNAIQKRRNTGVKKK